MSDEASAGESQYTDTSDAAMQAAGILSRVAGEGGILGQIAAGDWDERLTPDDAAALARRLWAMSETVRLTRAAGWAGDQGDEYPRWPELGKMLPLNRKERFWTGTVLPAIITTPYFVNLDIFLKLCGLPDVHIDADTGPMQLFTEYNLTESIFTTDDRTRLPAAPQGGDTPDLVICGDGWLLAVEAKMFHTPSIAALAAQLDRQRLVLRYLQSTLDIPIERTHHVLLVPGALPTGALTPVVTWEQVLARYDGIAPAYWVNALREALHRYKELRTAKTTPNGQGWLSGAEIIEQHATGAPFYGYIGRIGDHRRIHRAEPQRHRGLAVRCELPGRSTAV